MKKLNFKALIMPFFVAIIVLLPFSTTAQGSDGFFRANESENYQNRDISITSGTTLGGATQMDPTAPLGSGLLVMVAAGAGYVALKHKRSNRASKSHKAHMSYMLALAMVLAFTGCKKKEIITLNNADGGIFITLDATYGGDKTGFNPGDGTFIWTNGATEYIYVGGDGHGIDPNTYVMGVLSGTGNGKNNMTFSGTLTTPPSDGEKLYFYYLGSGERIADNQHNNRCISDQDGTLANVTKHHMAIGYDNYTTNKTSFSTTLNMAMSIARIDLSGFGNVGAEVRIYGEDVFSTCEVDYPNGQIVGKARGSIKTTIQSEGNYIALIPSTQTITTLHFISDTKEGSMDFKPGIQAGYYYAQSGGLALTFTQQAIVNRSEPAGMLSGEFTISSSGNTVKFSKGNLQYIGSAAKPYWKFADNQYDYIGNAQEGTNENIDRDLFGWGTSGYHNNNYDNNLYYYPYSTNNTNNQYGPTFNNSTPRPATNNFMSTSIDYDWGMHNAIRYGNGYSDSDAPGKWRVLTNDEWKFLLNTRTTTSGIRYVFAKVNNSDGLILLPDNWNTNYYTLVYDNNDYGANTIDATTWVTKLAANGAVFLPSYNYRIGENIGSLEYGIYWSSTSSTSNGNDAYYFGICKMNRTPPLAISTNNKYSRSYGCFVRLVHDIN